jgi:molybdopterin-guanine dinucleotide biosynthesis protein A
MRARCTGVILAGGASTRFGGRAKGLEIVGGRTIVDRVARALGAVADDVLLIANAPDARLWLSNVRVASDMRPERGSLVGVYSALSHARSSVLVVAWDMPFVSRQLLELLRREGEASDCAVVPETPRGVEPLCAYYPYRALDVAARLLDAGDMRLSAFVDALPCVRKLDASRLLAYGDWSKIFFNVNDIESLDRARVMAKEEDPEMRE